MNRIDKGRKPCMSVGTLCVSKDFISWLISVLLVPPPSLSLLLFRLAKLSHKKRSNGPRSFSITILCLSFAKRYGLTGTQQHYKVVVIIPHGIELRTQNKPNTIKVLPLLPSNTEYERTEVLYGAEHTTNAIVNFYLM